MVDDLAGFLKFSDRCKTKKMLDQLQRGVCILWSSGDVFSVNNDCHQMWGKNMVGDAYLIWLDIRCFNSCTQLVCIKSHRPYSGIQTFGSLCIQSSNSNYFLIVLALVLDSMEIRCRKLYGCCPEAKIWPISTCVMQAVFACYIYSVELIWTQGSVKSHTCWYLLVTGFCCVYIRHGQGIILNENLSLSFFVVDIS